MRIWESALRDGLTAAAILRDDLNRESDRPSLLDALLPLLGGHAALTDKLASAIVASPPLDSSKGGYIAEGYDAVFVGSGAPKGKELDIPGRWDAGAFCNTTR